MWLQNLFLSDCLVRISYPMADDQNPTRHRPALSLPLCLSLIHKLFHTMHSLSFPLTYAHAHPLTLFYPSPQGHTQPQLTIGQVSVGASAKLSIVTWHKCSLKCHTGSFDTQNSYCIVFILNIWNRCRQRASHLISRLKWHLSMEAIQLACCGIAG